MIYIRNNSPHNIWSTTQHLYAIPSVQTPPVLEYDTLRLDTPFITDSTVTNTGSDIPILDKSVNGIFLVSVSIINNNWILNKYREKMNRCGTRRFQ